MGCSGSSSASGPVLLGQAGGQAGAPSGKGVHKRLSLVAGPEAGVDVGDVKPEVDASGVKPSVGVSEAQLSEEDRDLVRKLDKLQGKSIIELIDASGVAGGRRMSISSVTDLGTTGFGQKATEKRGDELDLSQSGIGHACCKGLKPGSPNQDSWFIVQMEAYSIYGVFDGHGEAGHLVSDFVKETLPKLVVKDPRFGTAEMPAMLKDLFRKMQGLVSVADRAKRFSAQLAGTTATICIHDHVRGKLTVAHVADSSCALGKGPGAAGSQAVRLTRDHKPDLEDERARIEAAGARVVFDGYANHRVFAKQGNYPGLNMSRCIGDLLAHRCGVTCEPEVLEHDIGADDAVLLLCSDGVWEFIDETEAVKMVSDFAPHEATTAAERLAKESWDRWMKEEKGEVVDDITVLCAYLRGRGETGVGAGASALS